jgi:hypothetical protein
MKFNYLLTALVGLTLLVASCKPTPVEEDKPAAANSFKCKVDGTEIGTATTVASYENYNFNLTATFTNGKSIKLTLINALRLKPGTFVLSQIGPSAATYTPSTGVAPYISNDPYGQGGSVIITAVDSINKKISGTFSFNGMQGSTSSTNITEGVFTNISYTAIIPPPVSVTMNFSVDGIPFVSTQKGALLSNGTIAITVSKSEPGLVTAFSLFIPAAKVPGTYILQAIPGNNDITARYEFNRGGANLKYNYTVSGATITVSQHTPANRRIKGTFSGRFQEFLVVGAPIYNITGGTFDVTY